jgi:predicted DNA-binding protein (MmcQ/YjbR family)
MNLETVREFLLTLPHVEETVQWGDNLVFWVGDKAIGGKMFVVANPEPGAQGAMSFAAELEAFAELCEREGVMPAPYLARMHWVRVERWTTIKWREQRELLRTAHAVIFARLAKRTQAVLAMPAKEREKIVRERKKVLAKKSKKR